jgi:hypothetical protein
MNGLIKPLATTVEKTRGAIVSSVSVDISSKIKVVTVENVSQQEKLFD